MVAANARAWPQLAQLRELSVEFKHAYDAVSRKHMAAILAGMAASTGLTKLNPSVRVSDKRKAQRLAVCPQLAALTGLQDLSIHIKSLACVFPTLDAVVLVSGDALALTRLTCLTRLVLDRLGDRVGDWAAFALASDLKQLCHLELTLCALGSMRCLVRVGQLTQLTELGLEHNPSVTQRGLMQLTGLTGLQQLHTTWQDEAQGRKYMKKCWAAVRQQRR
jgi:hypothetical protein